jgi:hypothetical protein
MFEGIIISMYNGNEHEPPHFHARYSGEKAVFDFDGEIISGKMPRNKAKLVTAWAVLHRDELEADWELVQMGEPLYKINPLTR